MSSPSYFEFGSQVTIMAGHQALEQLPDALLQLGTHRPMIITDKGVAGAGLVATVARLLHAPLELGHVADDVPTDSEISVVNRIASQYRRNRCDGLIALGGGSVLDTAKGVNILVSERADDLARFAGKGMLKRPLSPLVAIPTTGSGSEVTMAAVIKDKNNRTKRLFVSGFLLPRLAVLDPRLTLTLPPAMTAATAMDALCHAVEAYYCLAKNPISDSHSLIAIEMIRQNLPIVMAHPEDAEARLALAIAANLAGSAFSNSMVGMVHSVGHALGAVCGIPHGVCMAIMLPYGLEYNQHLRSEEISQLLLPLAGPAIFASTPRHRHAEAAIGSIRRLNDSLHEATDGKHPRFLKEIKGRNGEQLVTTEKMTEIARKAIGDGSILYNPEEMDERDCLRILDHAYEGAPMFNPKA